ncbi:glycosyltransferase family 2 protein [Marivirga harenae]|uniref:glycosyltransferase family 2 protein n=1 Tax=Marivirga harenae TaxID=2010992 RepID=UPI0026E06487|nr:glycosyltransferase family 2 protein [Marivirga harenae]WKV13431.1 glycosyltransferase family 2 protein [Marivirga harenae]
MRALISIIIPFYQAEKYLNEAIESVFNQTHENWELLLINDGSTDNSKKIALSFNDKRIRYFEQENNGVSSARNRGLKNIRGHFFCFLDADDVLTITSLEHRLKVFEDKPEVTFVDGQVVRMNSHLNVIYNVWTPSFSGNPLTDLVKLTGKSFFGPTWMVKSSYAKDTLLDENLTHGEELFYYMKLSRNGGLYSFTTESILYYRDSPNSVMNNLSGLENGYRYIESKLKKWKEIRFVDLVIFRLKFLKSMTLDYLSKGSFIDAIRIWFKNNEIIKVN